MSKHKKQYGKTRLGMFISKAGEFIPEIAGAGLKLATGNITGALEDVGGILTANKENNEKAKELHLEFEIKKMDFAKECFALEVEDRKDARVNGNNHLQLVVAYFSLIGFTCFGGINIWIAYEILTSSLDVNEFIIMTSSNIFGIFTGLIFTLKDFLYGGSVDKN